MPRRTAGSVYRTKTGWGIRWPENGERPHKAGFRTKTEAREWFDKQVAPRLRRRGPSAEVTFEAFCVEYLDRWEPGVAARTGETMRERLAPARDQFGAWTLTELEGATDDIARWRRSLPSEHARYKNTRALRQVLAAAVRWGHIARNPAVNFGQNPEPRAEEIRPFTRAELAAIAEEMSARDAALVIFAAEAGLRTNEWIALERRDIDRHAGVVVVRQRVTEGKLYVEPKNGHRRRVVLSDRASAALDRLPLTIPLVFPAAEGGYINLNNWRRRVWRPALEAAGIEQRGPYALRHTFAAEALAAGVSIYELAEVMGTSIRMIERHYGHLVEGGEDRIRALLNRMGDA